MKIYYKIIRYYTNNTNNYTNSNPILFFFLNSYLISFFILFKNAVKTFNSYL